MNGFHLTSGPSPFCAERAQNGEGCLPVEYPLARFRRALRRDDQRVLDDLLDAAQERLAVPEYGLAFEMLLLFVLLAEGREVLRLWQQIDPYTDSPWTFPARIPRDG